MLGAPTNPRHPQLEPLPCGKQSNESDWDGFAGFIAFGGKLLVKKEKEK